MKKGKLLVILAVIVLSIGGCKNKCECPNDAAGTNKVETQIISDYSELYRETVKSVVFVKVQKKRDKSLIATGSGVVTREEGEYAYIYTNAHVLSSMTTDYEVEVFFSNEKGFFNGESELAYIMGQSKEEDVAVLRINKSEKYEVAILGNSDLVERGNFVYTIGSPLGKLNYTTSGHVSAVNYPEKLDSSNIGKLTTIYSIMTDAPINKGNSGGALFNELGELIGITAFKYEKHDSDGDGISDDICNGLYGSLPINYFSKVARELIMNERYSRPKINATLLSINDLGTKRDSYGISIYIKTGVYVTGFSEVAIDLETNERYSGDTFVIKKINEKTVESIIDLEVEILKYNVGDEIKLTIINKEGLNEREIQIVLHA